MLYRCWHYQINSMKKLIYKKKGISEMEKEKKVREKNRPSLLEALSMIAVLLGMIILAVQADISIIPALVIAIVWSMAIAVKCGYSWDEIMKPILDRQRGVVEIFLIILAIGMFVASMIYSGTIPTIIYYLINIISPNLMVVLSFIITAVVSCIIGTSWGTAGTVGVDMLSIAQSMGVPMAIVAGAVASGSHVGQILSPMSDTSNVSASLADVDTVTMIKRMAHYAIPVIIIASVVYAILGFANTAVGGNLESAALIRQEIAAVFNVNPLVILPMVFVFFLTFKKKPILMTLTLTSLIGLIFGMIFNGFSFVNGLDALYNGFNLTGTVGIAENGFNDIFLNLVNRGGAMSMINAALLVIVATMYGTILLETKAIDVIAVSIFGKVKSRPMLVTSSVFVSGLVVAMTSSSFLATMMSKDLFIEKFEKEGMDSMDLVSSCATASTQFLTCIPWCDTAIFLAALSGVSTLDALPYNVFSWGCAAAAIGLSIFGIGFKNGKRFVDLTPVKAKVTE